MTTVKLYAFVGRGHYIAIKPSSPEARPQCKIALEVMLTFFSDYKKT